MAQRRLKGTLTLKGGRKPSPQWERWERERVNLTQLLENLKNSTAMGGEKWRQSMIKHYTQRIADHKKARPPKFEEA